MMTRQVFRRFLRESERRVSQESSRESARLFSVLQTWGRREGPGYRHTADNLPLRQRHLAGRRGTDRQLTAHKEV